VPRKKGIVAIAPCSVRKPHVVLIRHKRNVFDCFVTDRDEEAITFR
jgi:hypothetical protein